MHYGDPVGEVHPEGRQRTMVVGCFDVGPPVIGKAASSPVAVQGAHLNLDVTADAVAIVSFHQLSHHTNANLVLMFTKDKALHFGGHAAVQAKATPVRSSGDPGCWRQLLMDMHL